jgi:hypothetical protein
MLAHATTRVAPVWITSAILAIGAASCSSSEEVRADRTALKEAPVTGAATREGADATPAPGSGSARAPGSQRDLRALQGRWQDRDPGERHEGDEANAPARTVKEVAGNRETLTTYAADGTVVYAHAVEFRLEQEGRVPVFTFFNREVTAGASKGQKFPEPASYMYRLRGNVWEECWGFLPEHRDRDVLVKRWTRVRDRGTARAGPN